MAILDSPFSILDFVNARLASEIFLNNLQTKSKEYSKGENK